MTSAQSISFLYFPNPARLVMLRESLNAPAAGQHCLACGLFGDKRKLRQRLVLKAYIDGSGSHGQPVLVLAGYVATVEQWIAFTDEWDEWLNKSGRQYFKMAEMVGQPEIAASFYRIVEAHITAGLACAVPCEPVAKMARELGLAPLDNPYYFANKAIINVTAQHQAKMGITEPIDFIFDDQSERARVQQAWDAYVNGRITPDVRALTGVEPAFLNDVDHPPLQAADLYAWWLRRTWEQGGMEAFLQRCPFPWSVKRDFPRFLVAITEDEIRVELEKVQQLIIEARQPTFHMTVTFTGLKDRDD